jgi:hypothetical protein
MCFGGVDLFGGVPVVAHHLAGSAGGCYGNFLNGS